MSSPEISVAGPKATIINQQQFSNYAQAWVQAAGTGNHLVDAFQKVGYERLTYASFDLQTVIWLVSTVGARRIKAQFVLVPPKHAEDAKHEPARFSVVLYAVDALDGRISAYYLGNNDFTPNIKQIDAEGDFGKVADDADAVGNTNVGAPVAFDLVKRWLTNWSSPKQQISCDLFSSKYGPLQGYTFDLGDFMDPLFYSQKFGDTQVLHVGFGLHEYHAAFTAKDEPSLTRTFGLVLRFYGTVASDGTAVKAFSNTGAVNAGEPGQPFYDLSTPNPPGSYDAS
jgi:hypothetical protein